MRIYMNKIDFKSNALIDVFIEDKRNKDVVSTVVAPRGDFYRETDRPAFHMRLYNGAINQVDLKKQAVYTINFDTYDVNLDLKKGSKEEQGRIMRRYFLEKVAYEHKAQLIALAHHAQDQQETFFIPWRWFY